MSNAISEAFAQANLQNLKQQETIDVNDRQHEEHLPHGERRRRGRTPEEMRQYVQDIDDHMEKHQCARVHAINALGYTHSVDVAYRRRLGIKHGHRKVSKSYSGVRTLEEKRAFVAAAERFHAEGLTIQAACKKAGLADPTFYVYKKAIAAHDGAPPPQDKTTPTTQAKSPGRRKGPVFSKAKAGDLIAEAIHAEVNNFVTALDNRIETAMNEAVESLHKRYNR